MGKELINPPDNEIEQLLAELWQELLRCKRVGRYDRFLDLGGDSLVTAQLVARVERAFGLEFELLEFFDAPTVAAQAALIEQRLFGGPDAESGLQRGRA